MGELGTYKPFDWPRLCDVCGNRRRISTMVKKPGGVWVCDIHKNERTAVELDRLNAKVKPYNIIPVPNAKPQSQYPDVMEAEEAVIMNFVQRMVTAGARYESVISGQPTPIAGHMIEGLSWSARYLYTVITDTTIPSRVLLTAKAQLLSISAQLLARQQGFGISTSSTKTNDAFWGGFLESGASTWVTEDTAMSGLALLYAYRVFGIPSYLISARAAASYLRNVQAIGSNGTNYTSSDSAGAGRLYTGSLASQVSTASGFYSDHSFYASSLLALLFWNELKITDGDQQIGSDGTPTGFTSIPQQLMSTSMTDLRACWQNGITDSTGTIINGLSSTTPREFFNAYPATKANFDITGTGLWEYVDGGASIGTQISSLNVAKALSSLYSYEGASSQVTTLDDWTQTFVSNEEFETSDSVSARTLARSTTGTFVPMVGLSTLLTVRDQTNSYAAVATNGSSLYDWGAFGLLSPLWSARHGGTFPDSRRSAFGSNQRFDDGSRSDGDYIDWITLRGLSGLTLQTGFGTTPPALADVAFPQSRMRRGSNLVFALSGITVPAGELTRCGYWRFASGIGAIGRLFPYKDSIGEIPVGEGVVLFNANVTLTTLSFLHLNTAATATQLPFSLMYGTTVVLAFGSAIQFVRDGDLNAWRQTSAPFVLSDNTTSPILMLNDLARASMFGIALRQNPVAQGIPS